MMVWDASVDIVSVMGVISEKSEEGGAIIARISGAKVTISITTVSTSAVKLRVKARKAFFPKISVAQDVFVKIVGQLSE